MKLTEEHKKKISQALKGRAMSAMHKDKISRALSGKKKSQKHNLHNKLSHIGHKITEETRQKMRENNSGKRNPNYKGGNYPLSKSERNRFKKTIAKEVLKRDNYTCQLCGGKENLHVDHIQSWSEYPDLRFSIDNCRTLCMSCHYFITWGKPIEQGKNWGIKTSLFRERGTS